MNYTPQAKLIAVSFRITEQQLKALSRAAKKKQLNRSELLRNILSTIGPALK